MYSRYDTRNLIAFITGATAGIGAAIARRLVAEGAKVVITGRREDRLQALKEELGEQACALPLDVQDETSIRTAVESLPAAFSDINLLINNAGLAQGGELSQDAELENWRTMIDTNVTGLLQITHALLPGMTERNEGHIINIGSVAGNYPAPRGNVYAATKAFANHFSLTLRADLGGTDLRVTSIEPGMVETEFSKVRYKGDEEKARGVYEGLKVLSSEDIAEAVFWASTLPPHMNINRIEVMPTAQSFNSFALYPSED
ncbi:SDR family NAD(P)-dependent oxidoreductase [Fodinicurvata halophila]|uniref:SDR family NAD(P)-dependent oxidoreductase n=1 Tax=Fodinicurvata halophila TaxID=1419723 RepID=A0ABV8UKQ9_9PROT